MTLHQPTQRSQERLHARLDAGADVTLVRGPVASGKTTLVAAWARTRRDHGQRVLWLDGEVPPEIREGRGAGAGGGPAIVVLDDADRVRDLDALDALLEVLDAAGTRLVVISRRHHPVIDRLPSRGATLAVIDERELRVDAADLREAAWGWGELLTDDEAEELVADTAGWIGLARAVAGRLSGDAARLAGLSFVHTQAFPADPETMGHAMLFALAEHVTVDIARVVVDSVSAASPSGRVDESLASLVSAGFLRPQGGAGPAAWRFPPLIGEVLAEAGRRHFAAHLDTLHSAAARSLLPHAAHDDEALVAAVRHASSAADDDLLGRLWVEHWPALTRRLSARVVPSFVERTRGLGSADAGVRLAASVLSALQNPVTGPRSYEQLGWSAPAPTAAPASATDALVVSSAVIAHRRGYAYEEALRLCRRLDDRAHPPLATTAAAAWLRLQRGLTEASHSDPEGVPRLESVAAAPLAGAEFIAAIAAASAAAARAIRGETAQTRELLRRLDELDSDHGPYGDLVRYPADVARALLRFDRLDPSPAGVLDHRALSRTAFDEWPLLLPTRTRQALLFGSPAVMIGEVSRLRASAPPTLPPQGRIRRLLDRTFADLLLALGEVNRARRFFDESVAPSVVLSVPRARMAAIVGDHVGVHAEATGFGWSAELSPRDRAELAAILAGSAWAAGDHALAGESFARAGGLAGEIATLVPFAGMRRDAFDALSVEYPVVLAAEDVQRVRAVREVYPREGALVTLSPRETAVLRAIDEHARLADAAAALSVSVNTVKKQVAAVYAKLGVNDRQAALAAARREGLLADA
ncbi:LuxR C-terminal-related transcriptional regulator [Microbacterium sp. TNHR37B]|uniref:LuxR C-terminal-related transcriptional regulator n=1 Tax=Microbacterium sp. TNHR37B TaxID=1775956 RepID=UPI0007B236DA|nr:LuxR C-terminal-related transcriptional regulator [Microbacterium sp. TNHR37B]KZE90029.1 HTH-type transcriptional regulator MalT [Microbacterium sp. TNHR37B]